jgi:uncharacterized protein YdcH (DUF465 family)
MSHTPHDLAAEFPDKVDEIHNLKTTNAHFLKLFDSYHEVNDAIYLAETNVKPTDQFHEEDLRKQRLRLKDEIAAMLAYSVSKLT